MPSNIQPLAPTFSAEPRKYFKLQLKAWTSFDPTDRDLTEIAEAMRNGAGYVTLMEVTQVTELKEIADGEVRERFENIVAAEKVIRNLDKLPPAIRKQLYSALANEEPGPLTPQRADSEAA